MQDGEELGKYQDSFTIGTASTGGAIKVYGKMGEDEFAKKIDRAIAIHRTTTTKK